MEREESLNKSLYKILLYLIKVIPMVMAFLFIVDTILGYMGIDCWIISYISGNSLLTIVFFYLSSYIFKFCAYHRMFIHYNTFTWLVNIYDWYIGIPIQDRDMLILYMSLTAATLFIILYLYVKGNRKSPEDNS